MMRITSLAAVGKLKDILMRDFSEPLVSQIIKHAYDKHGINEKSFNNGGKTKLINTIVSDYRAIKPIGSVSAVKLKKNLRLSLK
jgi:hypothetical protein